MFEALRRALLAREAATAGRAKGAVRQRARRDAPGLCRNEAARIAMARAHDKYQRLIDFCKALPPTPTAVAHPCDESSLRSAVDAAKMGLIAPILVGPRARIEAVAKEHGLDIAAFRSSTRRTATSRPRRRSRWCARARRRR